MKLNESTQVNSINSEYIALIGPNGNPVCINRADFAEAIRSVMLEATKDRKGLVSIDFLSVIPSVTITVKDAETDKVVYSSTELNVNDCTVDLAGENPGKYTIDIYIGENIFSGSFFIEEESNYQI